MRNRHLKLSGIMLVGVIIIVTFVYAVNIQPVVMGDSSWFKTFAGLNTFSSYEELAEFLRRNHRALNYDIECQMETKINIGLAKSFMSSNIIISPDNNDCEKPLDYSKTNVQIEGVDEPDTVKTDGTYLYIYANSKIYIVKVYPAEDATILSNISFNDIHVCNFFIKNNYLIIFANSYRYPINYISKDEDILYWNTVSTTVIKIYDISDKEIPEITKNIEVDGLYFNARMIENYIYIITTEYSREIYYNLDGNIIINLPEITINNCTKKLPVNCIYYVNNSESIDIITNVISINIDSGGINQKSFLLGSSQKMYVSRYNIYLACNKYNYYRSFFSNYNIYYEATVIHKISIKNGDICYSAKGVVPGRILNQFSMDEYNGYFRIATTVGNVWDSESKSSNNIYILNDSLKQISGIEKIAPGEKIYSARFMGNKAYLVTFKKIDPFFTIDLSDPYNPKVLGELKIPGYSDYLHPYDENHIIGIGKDTVEALDAQKESRGIDFAWYQGIKIALFDVSDFENPKEIAKIIIGDRGTDSLVLHDHKAFLFNMEKELLVIPIKLYEIPVEIKEQNNGYTGNTYGKFTFQGAYIYRLSLVEGFQYIGRITHMDDDHIDDDYYWYSGLSSSYVFRSLYIGNVLYTISEKKIKMNSLNDLHELNIVKLE